MERRKFILFGEPMIGPEEEAAVLEVLRSGWIGMGPKCQEFEAAFAAYVGTEHAIAVSSCTAALHLSLLALGVGKGDEVITTPFTFAATLNSILYVGARPVLVDIDPATLNIDPERVRTAITPRTKAIMPVHFGGLPCDMDALTAVSREKGVVIVEDAAHAVGAKWGNVRIGGISGTTACFSFYPNKNLATFEGGMVTTDSSLVAEKIKTMRLHGLDNEAWKRYHAGTQLTFSEAGMQGFKYNMTDMQAAMALVQLSKLEGFLDARELHARQLDEAFSALPVRRPTFRKAHRHGLHLYNLLLDHGRLDASRDEIVTEIREAGIGATVHYRVAHLHPYFREVIGHAHGDFPIAEKAAENILTLPIQPKLTQSDVAYIAQTVGDIIRRHCIT